MDDKVLWNIIHSHFYENPQTLVSHHIESYNDFLYKDIYEIFRNQNPVVLASAFDETIQDYRHKCKIYMGGKDGSRIYFGKPIIHDKDHPHYMYPNEARLRNMTYAMTVHYDVEIELEDILEPGQAPYEIGPEFIGGDELRRLGFYDGGGGDADESLVDYTEEHEKIAWEKMPNYKKGGGIVEEAPGVHDVAKDTYQVGLGLGGGPKKPQQPYKMTAALAARLREISEQSMSANNVQKRSYFLPEKIYLGKIPIMVQSDFCILNGLSKEMRYNFGECRSDPGGYFIIDGKEKTVIIQEKFADNTLNIKADVPEDDTEESDVKYPFSVEIKSVSENVSKPKRTTAVRIRAPTGKWTYGNIVVDIPNVRSPVPLFIVFRALGILSDKEIVSMCLLDIEKYEFMTDLLIPSVHDAANIIDQATALQFIADLTRYHVSVSHVMEILSDYFLPHIGETNYKEKAYFLGFMVFRLLSVSLGLELPTDRDSLKHKRIELVGSLMRELFNEYYSMQLKHIYTEFDRIIFFNRDTYENDLHSLIISNYRQVFGERIVDVGLRKAFKGSWGGQSHTKRVGIVQDLNRLSFNSAISHLRKTNLPLDSSLKLVGPRVLHGSHWGYIDPVDTPDGGNIGLHKTLAIMAYVSRGYSREKLADWLKQNTDIVCLNSSTPLFLSTLTKVFINGMWIGSIAAPLEMVSKFRLYRRNGLIPLHTSVSFDIRNNIIHFATDAGRVCRPIFYKDELTGKLSFENSAEIAKKIQAGEFTWTELISGFNRHKQDVKYHPNDVIIRSLPELFEGIEAETNPSKLERFIREKAVIEYLDSSESEQSLIAINKKDWNDNVEKQKRYTHMEIHESLMFGVMCNQIIFPENNPVTRNSFSCSQSRQACSMFHTNFQYRMDKNAVVLNSGQIPLLKTRYFEHINGEMNPYGENVIVAIMCMTGYNVEDAILVNEGSLKRGMFRTTYYTSYKDHEEKKTLGDKIAHVKFANIESEQGVVGLKPGHDYSRLDKYGLIREGSYVDDKTVLIGMVSTNSGNQGVAVDRSVMPKKGQLGVVDRTFITEGEEGERIAKVRIREERIPNLGDKMASRAGQKGTVGLVVPEYNMPFTRNGVRPDLIINPHAKPSRQTLGQLIECLVGKAVSHYGMFGDCTAFANEGSKIGVFGELLQKIGYHSSGNEVMYDGMSGRQIETEIFIGPTYYMRLKHMVKDKINYRALGPRTALTRQPVAGRANDGGLRIGEMERDVLIAHGLNNFLNESMLERGDKFYLAVCNNTGVVAVYNPDRNLFLSPMADGPIQWTAGVDGTSLAMEPITKFGRNFSVVRVPYSFKLLMQELAAINVQMRIITEDNIQQIENMAFSNNIQKLTGDADLTAAKLVDILKKEQRAKVQRTPLSYVETEMEWKYSPGADAYADAYADDGMPKTPEMTPPDTDEFRREQQQMNRVFGILEQRNMDLPRTPDEPHPNAKPTPDSPPTNPYLYAARSPESSVDSFPGPPNYPPPGMRAGPGTPDYPPPGMRAGPGTPDYPPPGMRAGPGTPDYPPPGFMGRNGLSHIDQFQIGSNVYYRKSDKLGLSPEHIWRVINKGRNFITIESMADLDRNNKIQIVEPDELLLPEQYQELASSVRHTENHQMSLPIQPNMTPAAAQPNINIKIVNGDDKSGGEPGSREKDENQGDLTFSNFHRSQHKGGTNVEKGEPNQPQKEEQSIMGGLKDFSKLLIRKIT